MGAGLIRPYLGLFFGSLPPPSLPPSPHEAGGSFGSQGLLEIMMTVASDTKAAAKVADSHPTMTTLLLSTWQRRTHAPTVVEIDDHVSFA